MRPNPAYHYGRWGGGAIQNATIAVPVLAPARSRQRRPILSALKAMLGIPSASPGTDYPICVPTPSGQVVCTGGTSRNAPIRCWGPAWDRSCKVCAPLPSGGESCTSFKVNDTSQVPRATSSYVYGKTYRR